MLAPSRPRAFFQTETVCTLLLVLLSVTIVAHGQIASFPSRVTRLKSSDGRYVIQNIDYDDRDPAHDLFLLDTKAATKTIIQSYGRGVDVLWSPGSDAFVVNDHEGSDSARPLLYSLPWTGRKTDLLEELTGFMRQQHEEKRMQRNDHVYLTARRWTDTHEILCRLEGYGGGSEFNGTFVYTVGKGFRVYHTKSENK